MKENFHVRSARHCTIFIVVHLAFSLLLVLAAPRNFAEIPKLLALWGQAIQAVIPSVQALSRITTFEAQAWVMLVAMWTAFPFSVWWVARGDWVMDTEYSRFHLRPRPWVLLTLVIVFVLLVVFFAIWEPTLPVEAHSRGGRMLARAAVSPMTFGTFMGMLFCGLAIALGVMPKMLRVLREAATRSAR